MPRLLTLLMLCCALLFGLRIATLFDHKDRWGSFLFIDSVNAEEKKPEEKKEEKPEEKKSEGHGEKKSEKSKEDAPKEGEAKKDDAKEGGAEEVQKPENVNTFSETEVEILKRLGERRKKLDEWERDLEVKRNALRLTETRIEQKLIELKQLKSAVEVLLTQYNEKEDAKIRSLVKIYESMKPKDAARIFDEVDIEVVLQVIDKMKEVKSALILANMSAERAKEITTHFAKQKKLPDEPLANVSGLPKQ